MKAITIKATDSEERQYIAMLEGLLEQQKTYTSNAVSECMRMRKIIGGCERCRTEANKLED